MEETQEPVGTPLTDVWPSTDPAQAGVSVEEHTISQAAEVREEEQSEVVTAAPAAETTVSAGASNVEQVPATESTGPNVAAAEDADVSHVSGVPEPSGAAEPAAEGQADQTQPADAGVVISATPAEGTTASAKPAVAGKTFKRIGTELVAQVNLVCLPASMHLP